MCMYLNVYSRPLGAGWNVLEGSTPAFVNEPCVFERAFACPSRPKRDNAVDLNKDPNLKPNECYLEHIGDSGAGKMIWSERALGEQGFHNLCGVPALVHRPH
eukprot:12427487-Karenia_brevis.AAC.1